MHQRLTVAERRLTIQTSVKARTVAFALLVLFLGGCQDPVAALSAPNPAGGAPADARLWSRLQHIASAFQQGDAGALRLSCSSGGKVRIDLRDMLDGQGAYGPGQVQVIFRDIFDEYRTRDFEFPRDNVKVSPSGTAFARGRWVRKGQGGREAVDNLTFTLREEGGDWRIQEIRSSR